MLLWTSRDDDTIERCKVAVENSKKYAAGVAMPWFGLCVKMFEELQRSGLIKRIEAEQLICGGCVWATEGGGCKQHFEGAHVDADTGEVRFCPRKTTQTMRENQLRMLHQKKKRA